MNISSGSALLSVNVHNPPEPAAGPDLLFLHAGVTDQRSWQAVIRQIPHHRSITIDQRGFGLSSYAPEPQWSPVLDALRVLDVTETDRAVVVGSSLGGRVAVDLALDHPERVAGLVLIAPAVHGAPYPEPTAVELALEEASERAQEAGRFDDANAFEAHLWLDGPTSPEGRVSGAARDLFLEMNGRALRATTTGDPAPLVDAWSRLGQISVPALLLAGTLDVSDLKAVTEQMVGQIRDARFVEMAGVAHLPQLESPEMLATHIAKFLEPMLDKN